jgi:hypothetical protein
MTDGAKAGTFLVTGADDGAAVLRDVTDGQVHTLSENPGLSEGEVVVATVAPEPPMEVTWTVEELTSQREIPVGESPEPPTKQAREIAAEQSVGEMTRQERAGEGELHVITVPDEETEQATADVLEDEATLTQAAKLGVARVEVRAADGVVSVRYLPD